MVNEVEYPNREHRAADRAARALVLKAVTETEAEAAVIRRRLEGGKVPDLAETRGISRSLLRLAENLSALAVLREVREWDAADKVGG